MPPWEIAPRLLPSEPQPQAIPSLNPGLGGKWAATSTLWAGVQILLPGETAPVHRHSPAAIRFIIRRKGADTTVQGDQSFIGPGDLVLTPPWTWHDHGNDGAEADAVLFSVQNTPILQTLGLYREQAYEADDSHQPITREFRP